MKARYDSTTAPTTRAALSGLLEMYFTLRTFVSRAEETVVPQSPPHEAGMSFTIYASSKNMLSRAGILISIS